MLPILSARLAKHRLLYAFQMVTSAPQDLITCVTAEAGHRNGSPWCDALRHAVDWLRLQDPDGWALPSTSTTDELFRWLHDHRAEGPRYVRRLAHRAVQQDRLVFELKSKTRAIYDACALHGVVFEQLPFVPSTAARAEFSCTLCSSSFSTIQGLQAHQWRKHQIISEERKYIYDATCRACNRCFWTAQRLQQHLRWSRQHPDGCFHILQKYFLPVDAPVRCEVPSFIRGLARVPACAVAGPMPDVMPTLWQQRHREQCQALQRRWQDAGLPEIIAS